MKFEKEVKKIIGMSALVLLVSACTGGENKTHFIHDGERDGSKATPEGQSTGGGSFGDESSEYILNEAINDLTTRLKNIQDPIFADLPEGWSKERIIEVLKNTRRSKNKVVSRYSRELMFNYAIDTDTKEPYIEALNLFYSSHASHPVNHMSAEEFYPIMAEVRMKLMHEVSHLLGIGLTEDSDKKKSRAFAKRVVRSLLSALVYCETNEIVDPSDKFVKTVPYVTDKESCTYPMKLEYESVINDDYLPYTDSTSSLIEMMYSKAYREGPENMKYRVVVDRGTGRATTSYLPNLTSIIDRFQDESLKHQFQGDKPIDVFHIDWTKDPNFANFNDKDERLWKSLNNLRFDDGVQAENVAEYEEVLKLNFFDKVVLENDQVTVRFVLEFLDIVVNRVTEMFIHGVSMNTGQKRVLTNRLVPIRLNNLKEEIVYDRSTKTAKFIVEQDADLICQKERIPFDASFEMDMTCEAKEVKSVSVKDYL